MKQVPTNIRELLTAPETYYEIPNFQRPYSWQPVNALAFLEDLEDSIKKDKKHYFGTIVLVDDTKSEYSKAIIDGQQRVTTALLMITAIYHLVKKDPSRIRNPETTPELIRDRYLFNANIDKNKVKLRTVTTDNQILQRIFDVDGDDKRLKTQDPHAHLSNLFQVYETFRDYFAGKTGIDMYIRGLDLFEVVSITLDPRDDNPQRVFESINSTGRPLTDGDKIRNFALMLNTDAMRNHVYDKYWAIIEESLVDANKDYITDFFRSYITSRKAAIVRLDGVYPEFKRLFTKHVGEEQELDKLDAFYDDVIESLRFYKLLKLDDTDKFTGEYAQIGAIVFKMRYLQIDLYIPFAMSVLRHHADNQLTDQELQQAFNLIEVYFSRRIVCGIATTSVDRLFATLHRDILRYQSKNDGANYIEVLKYILLNRVGQTRLPSQAEYENAIRTREAYYQRNAFLIYILCSVESTSKEMLNTLQQIADGKLNLSVEHVMPQTLTSIEWQKMLGHDFERIHREYLHTLANLTLTGYNSEYSNRSFTDKKVLEIKNKKTEQTDKVGFAYSKLAINEWIAKQEAWTEDVLKSRQDWWIKKLSAVWPVPTTTFEPTEDNTTAYLLDDLDLKGSYVKSIETFGQKVSVTSWAEVLDVIAEAIYDRNPDFLDVVSSHEWLSGHIGINPDRFLGMPRQIHDTGIYISTAYNTNHKLRIIKSLAEVFNISHDNLKAEITYPKSSEAEEEEE